MCQTFFYIDDGNTPSLSKIKFLLIFNRDEGLERPTEILSEW